MMSAANLAPVSHVPMPSRPLPTAAQVCLPDPMFPLSLHSPCSSHLGLLGAPQMRQVQSHLRAHAGVVPGASLFTASQAFFMSLGPQLKGHLLRETHPTTAPKVAVDHQPGALPVIVYKLDNSPCIGRFLCLGQCLLSMGQNELIACSEQPG